jgi:hypothetical protein
MGMRGMMDLSDDPYLLGAADRDMTTAYRKKKRKNKMALTALICHSRELPALIGYSPHVERKPNYDRCGMTDKVWNRKKARRKMAKKARRRNR